MLLGYNHNITYKGSVFHIQTEDSGIKNPHIITLLYRDGVILCSKKTSYADILKIGNLETVVEDLMKEQHKDMMRRLKSGEFDARAFGTPQPEDTRSATPPETAPPVNALPSTTEEPTGVDLLFLEEVAEEASAAESPIQEKQANKKSDAVSLDDAILNFFGASK